MRTEQHATTTYSELLRYPQWLEKRKKILKRDNYRCYNCGSSYGLEVHHRQYHILKSIGDFRKPWAYPAINLVTLCNRCHQVGHKNTLFPSSMYSSPLNPALITSHRSLITKNHGHIFKTFRQNK